MPSEDLYNRKIQSSQRPSEGRDSTLMSNSEEPNFVIYNLIKEIDFLVESNNFFGAGVSDTASLNLHQGEAVDSESNGGMRSFAPSSQAAGFASLPSGLIADYKELLAFAIEVFQNNFSPHEILKHSSQIEKLLLRSYAMSKSSPGPSINSRGRTLPL